MCMRLAGSVKDVAGIYLGQAEVGVKIKQESSHWANASHTLVIWILVLTSDFAPNTAIYILPRILKAQISPSTLKPTCTC